MRQPLQSTVCEHGKHPDKSKFEARSSQSPTRVAGAPFAQGGLASGCRQIKIYTQHPVYCVILSVANVPVARCEVERGKTCNELRVLTSKSAGALLGYTKEFSVALRGCV